MKNKEHKQETSGSPSRAITCSADDRKQNAKRKKLTKQQHKIENIHVEQELQNGGYMKLTIAHLEIEWEE